MKRPSENMTSQQASTSSPPSPINIELDGILNSLDYAYKYRMSDYATSREAEEEYEREGLAEIAQAKEAILALINQEVSKAVVGELQAVYDNINTGNVYLALGKVKTRIEELRNGGSNG